MADAPWEISQISWKVMTDFNGPNDWRAPSRDHRFRKSRGGSNMLANIDIASGQSSIDDLKIKELKRRKLMLKDEIERLRHDHTL
jgi:hypothetical protein